jgi:DNA-binding PadR family transcriptional regulator
MALLTERPMHGYEMIQEIEHRTQGLWRPSAGSIYPTLALLEDEGLIRGEESQGKRRLAPSDEGREQAEARTGTLPWEHVTAGADPGELRLREAFAPRALPSSRWAAPAPKTRRPGRATCSTRRASASTRSSPRTHSGPWGGMGA